MIPRLIAWVRNAGEVYPGAQEDADDVQKLYDITMKADEIALPTEPIGDGGKAQGDGDSAHTESEGSSQPQM